ncbi:MAG: hypothetical protein AB7F08_04950, partial [Dongiaceae bacterium]
MDPHRPVRAGIGPEAERAPADVDILHRIAGVQDQIEQNLLQMHAVTIDARQAKSRPRIDPDPLL